jgi:hypothetical protein
MGTLNSVNTVYISIPSLVLPRGGYQTQELELLQSPKRHDEDTYMTGIAECWKEQWTTGYLRTFGWARQSITFFNLTPHKPVKIHPFDHSLFRSLAKLS